MEKDSPKEYCINCGADLPAGTPSGFIEFILRSNNERYRKDTKFCPKCGNPYNISASAIVPYSGGLHN